MKVNHPLTVCLVSIYCTCLVYGETLRRDQIFKNYLDTKNYITRKSRVKRNLPFFGGRHLIHHFGSPYLFGGGSSLTGSNPFSRVPGLAGLYNYGVAPFLSNRLQLAQALSQGANLGTSSCNNNLFHDRPQQTLQGVNSDFITSNCGIFNSQFDARFQFFNSDKSGDPKEDYGESRNVVKNNKVDKDTPEYGVTQPDVKQKSIKKYPLSDEDPTMRTKYSNSNYGAGYDVNSNGKSRPDIDAAIIRRNKIVKRDSVQKENYIKRPYLGEKGDFIKKNHLARIGDLNEETPDKERIFIKIYKINRNDDVVK